MSAEDIRRELQCSRPRCVCQTEKGNKHCPGPSHSNGDQNPSLSFRSLGSKVLLHCHAGCEQADVIAVLKRKGVWDTPERTAPTPIRRNAPQKGESRQNRTLVATFQYRDATGAIIAEKGRFEWPGADGKPEKDFLWRRPGDRNWSGGFAMTDLPLFGTELVAVSHPSERIVFVEGEKAAIACREKGLLAVCHPGSASQRDFGEDQLAILSGREVLIWPDNDVPGRKFAAVLHAALRPIASRITILQPTVDNEKDDAVEYFANGGTVADLVDNLAPLRPSVRYVDDDAITVDIPTAIGTVTFAFADITQAPSDISCEIGVSIRGAGQPTETMPSRLNVLSSSSVEAFRRNLAGFFPPPEKSFWTVTTIRAIALMREAIRDNDGTVHISQIEQSGPPTFLIETFVPENRPMLLFGDGESGKTWIANRMALAVALSGEMNQFSAKTGGVLYLDWETDPDTWHSRMVRMAEGLAYDEEELNAAPIHYRRVKGQPFADIIQTVRATVERLNIRLIVVDSLSAACGGPLADDVVAQRFINAYGRLTNVSMVAVGHISKDSDTQTPFGSIMWRNFFRMLWFAQKVADEGSSVVHMGLYNRKFNDGPRFKPVGFDLVFQDPDGKPGGWVQMDDGEVMENSVLAGKVNVWTRIRHFIDEHGRATVKEIAEGLELKEPTIRRELSDHKDQLVNLTSGPGRGEAGAYGLKKPDRQSG